MGDLEAQIPTDRRVSDPTALGDSFGFVSIGTFSSEGFVAGY